ncbi:MAG TPA: type II toxin-antitoxin system Phd/YefM family antitoxin [Candidatus Acidoferrum sp.]|jgi:prevent-host-death family protein
MKKEVNTHEAKTHLSRLLKRVALGEEITIASRGKPMARLVPIHEVPARKLGMFQGKFVIPDNFDEPLPGEILDAFEGKEKRKRKRKSA